MASLISSVLNSANSPFPVSVSVMRGNGDGTFQAAVSYLLKHLPEYVGHPEQAGGS